MEIFEEILTEIVNGSILVLELMGVCVIVAAGIRGFYDYTRHVPSMKLTLAKGLAVGLEFKMGSEILRTVIVREWEEIIVVAGIIGLRAALNFLIHWEIHEEMR
ncbi:MAG: DUF1622 domain-containing protein [Lachnospiraceae bacterium]|nr:DUF1622 domain-containing protein [Lachnospiraceae bacterium]